MSEELTWKCAHCGAKTKFRKGKRPLKCPICGYTRGRLVIVRDEIGLDDKAVKV